MFADRNRRLSRAGFSLVELAIVLLVISVIAGSAMSVGLRKSESGLFTVNEKRMTMVEEGVAAYVSNRGFLPCPARPDLALTDANYGVENCAATCVGAAPNNFCTGMVPFVTLNISDELAFDGWGRRLTYGVDQRLTATAANFRDTNPDDGNNATGLTVSIIGGAVRTADAIFVLVSHGPNGRCARDRNGAVIGCAVAGNVDEQENGDADRIFVQSPNRQANYDDVTRYMLKWQMIQRAGGFIDTALCEKAAKISLCDITDPSSGSGGPTLSVGPVGCTIETGSAATYPYGNAGMQHTGCTSTQMELASTIYALCYQNLAAVCNP